MKYVFVINATISLATEVEADSLEEAVEMAKERGPQRLCHQCSSGRCQSAWAGEFDCEPSEGELVDLHIDGDGPTFEEACEEWAK